MYSLHDRVLFALLVLREEEIRKLIALFDSIADAPLNRAQVTFRDAVGRSGYVCSMGRFRVYYYVVSNGGVTFTDLRLAP
jgi:hypothetical protein